MFQATPSTAMPLWTVSIPIVSVVFAGIVQLIVARTTTRAAFEKAEHEYALARAARLDEARRERVGLEAGEILASLDPDVHKSPDIPRAKIHASMLRLLLRRDIPLESGLWRAYGDLIAAAELYRAQLEQVQLHDSGTTDLVRAKSEALEAQNGVRSKLGTFVDAASAMILAAHPTIAARPSPGRR